MRAESRKDKSELYDLRRGVYPIMYIGLEILRFRPNDILNSPTNNPFVVYITAGLMYTMP